MRRPPKKSDDSSAELHAKYLRALRAEPPREVLDIDGLMERLEQAHSVYVEGGDGARTGFLMALGSVLAYLEGELPVISGHSDRLMLPLRRLQLGLEDLQIGVVHPGLAHVKTSGGTKLTRDQAEFRLLVCVAVDMLIRAGVSPLEARETAAKRLKTARFRRQRKGAHQQSAEINSNTIEGWERDQLKYWDKIAHDRRLTFEQWMYIRTFIGFSKGAIAGVQRERSPLLAMFDHIFKVVLPLEFSHLRVGRKK